MAGPASLVTVRTQRTLPGSAHTVWPLLCGSRMDHTSSVLFRLGVPQPLECRLPEGEGGVGRERECVSDQGVVHQRILVWVPEKRLGFRMERSEIGAAKSVTGIEDSFELRPTGSGVVVVRTTNATVIGRFRWLKRLALVLALKQVHRYVFRNWTRIAAASPP